MKVKTKSKPKTGCQFEKKSFTVPGAVTMDEKKCFKADCLNEGETCKECYMIQGSYIYYQQEG